MMVGMSYTELLHPSNFGWSDKQNECSNVEVLSQIKFYIMLDNIINLVKEEALKSITNNADVPAEKKEAAVETTASSIVDGIKSQLSGGNVSDLIGMFTGGSKANSSLTDSIQTSVISALVEKVGLSKGVANTIATTVIPAVMAMISKKNNDSSDSFDIGSIIESVSGDKKGGLLDAIGGIFGK